MAVKKFVLFVFICLISMPVMARKVSYDELKVILENTKIKNKLKEMQIKQENERLKKAHTINNTDATKVIKSISSLFSNTTDDSVTPPVAEDGNGSDGNSASNYLVSFIENDLEKIKTAKNKLAGGQWGLGLSVTKFNQSEIKEAVASGTEIITKRKSEYSTGLVLETHFWVNSYESNDIDIEVAEDNTVEEEEAEKAKKIIEKESKKRTVLHGPFFAMKLGNNDDFEIDSFSLGYMVGIKPKLTDKTEFKVGLGWHVDTKFKKSAYLDHDNQIQFKEGDVKGLTLMIGASF